MKQGKVVFLSIFILMTFIGLIQILSSKNPIEFMAVILIAVLSFIILMYSFVLIQSRSFKKRETEITGGKEVLYSGGANHFVGMEAVGGYLILTSDELIFVSHKINIQNHQLTIPLDDIIDVKPIKTMGIIPNGLLIIDNISTHHFVVNKRKLWLNNIDRLINI